MSSTDGSPTNTPSPSAISYSKTTLTAPLTTVITSESLFTSGGHERTTTYQIATVIPSGTEVINQGIESPKKKLNLTVIIAAALGGFIGIVLLAAAIFFIRRCSRRRPRMIPPSPTQRYSPVLPPPVPYGYQLPEIAQPHHEPPFMSEIQTDQGRLIHLPPQPVSEKRQRQLLQHRSYDQPRDFHPRPSVDETGSVVSGSYTTSSSAYSTNTPQAHSVLHRGHQPQHHHQRSRSTNSEASAPNLGDGRNIGGSIPPSSRIGPSPSYFGQTGGSAGGMQPVHEEQLVQPQYGDGSRTYSNQPSGSSTPQPTHHQEHQYQHQDPQATLRPYQSSSSIQGQGMAGGFASGSPEAPGGSSWDEGGASATVDRGDGTTAQVFQAKNRTIREPRRDVNAVDERSTNLSEIPPTYDSLQQQRAQRTRQG